MKNSKEKLQTIIIVILTIVLVFTLTIGIIKDKNENKKSVEEYNELSNNDELNKDEQEVQSNEIVKDDFYGKLRKKEDVKVLVLGDGLALSQGRTSENGIWDQGVKNLIQSTYGSNVELKSLAKNGASSAIGLDTVTNNDISGYDLILVCYGHNDNKINFSVEGFKENYQNIIDKVMEKNPDGIIIPIVPSTLTNDNAYSKAIKEVANNNKLNFADIKTTFINSGIGEGNLSNGVLPNDTGYQLYTESIGNVIKEKMK